MRSIPIDGIISLLEGYKTPPQALSSRGERAAGHHRDDCALFDCRRQRGASELLIRAASAPQCRPPHCRIGRRRRSNGESGECDTSRSACLPLQAKVVIASVRNVRQSAMVGPPEAVNRVPAPLVIGDDNQDAFEAQLRRELAGRFGQGVVLPRHDIVVPVAARPAKFEAGTSHPWSR
jgi:hypothetical protein